MNSDLNKSNGGARDTPVGRARSEPELRQAIVQALRASGVAVDEQVRCAAGAADIVTMRRDTVIEVKLDLTRKAIQWAVGQVLLYRAAINPNARAIVVGYGTSETAGLVDCAVAIGVEVVVWAEGREPRADLLSLPSALSPRPFALSWNIQSLAQSHGIRRVGELARFLGLENKSGLYGVWRGTAANISVARLELFARRLALEPNRPLNAGNWFRWDRSGHLIWAVSDVAEQVGLDAARLAFRAGLYPQQMARFWDGNAQFVFVDTLARLAAALDTEGNPFDVGGLFRRG